LALFGGPVLQIRAAEEVDRSPLQRKCLHQLTKNRPKAEAIAAKKDRIGVRWLRMRPQRKFHAEPHDRSHGYTVVPRPDRFALHIFGIGERDLTLNLEGTTTSEIFWPK